MRRNNMSVYGSDMIDSAIENIDCINEAVELTVIELVVDFSDDAYDIIEPITTTL
jgi:hypothetical protein